MKGENESRRVGIVRTAMEALYAFSHFLAPVMPITAQKIFDKLHTAPVSSFNLKDNFYNLVPGTPLTVGEILFQKILPKEEEKPKEPEKKEKAPKEKKEKPPKESAPASVVAEAPVTAEAPTVGTQPAPTEF